MPAIVAILLNMPPSLKLIHYCKNRRKTILAIISLLSQEHEKQRALSAPRFRAHSPVKCIKNLTAMCYKALKTKVAKKYSQSKNSIDCDVYGLEGPNKQAERYKPKVIMTVNFSKKNSVKFYRSK